MAPVLQVDPDAPAADVLARAADALRGGALIVYPTETLYAVGGRALDPDAARRTREAKGRPDGKPLPLVAADLDQARTLCADWPEAAARLAARFWPGPLTLVLRARDEVPAEVTAGEGSVAVRVPGRLLVRLLCQAAGPLLSTSANLAGQPPATRCADALAAVGESVELALDGGTCDGAPSTIVDVREGRARVLREGAIPGAEVLSALG